MTPTLPASASRSAAIKKTLNPASPVDDRSNSRRRFCALETRQCAPREEDQDDGAQRITKPLPGKDRVLEQA